MMTTTAIPSGTLIDQLQHDWDSTFDHQPNPWADRAELAPFATLGDITTHLAGCNSTVANGIAWALLNAYWDGDQDAARTLLHTMLPRARRLLRTARGRGFTEPAETVVASLWAAIADYKGQPHNVITTLAMNTLYRMGSPDLIGRRWDGDAPAEQALENEAFDFVLPCVMHQEWADSSTSRTEQAASEATALLAWAQREGLLSGARLQILARVHLSEDSPSLAHVAAELGISEAAARKRHSLGVQQLAAAVRDRLEI